MRGRRKVEWTERLMPVLAIIRKRFEREKPLRNVRIAACMHITAETANLMTALKSGGAQVVLCASNPLSTQDDIVQYLKQEMDVAVFANRGDDIGTYQKNILSVLGFRPNITVDDGADLVNTVVSERKALLTEIMGGTEETTSGVNRLRNMERAGILPFPIIAVNDAATKHLFDNRYGTGQSTLDGIIRATNILLAGTRVVVCGYGWCGRGTAMRAKGLGAEVIVTEINPIRALEAMMDGYRVMSMTDAAEIGQIFVTVTGNKGVIRKEHFEKMSDGAIVCNSGHFDVEVDVTALREIAVGIDKLGDSVWEYTLKNGRRIVLLAEGRLVNLVCADGHPASVMDLSFSNQALSAEYLVSCGGKLEKKVYPVPEEIDRKIARLKLDTMGINIDTPTRSQILYADSWFEGTR